MGEGQEKFGMTSKRKICHLSIFSNFGNNVTNGHEIILSVLLLSFMIFHGCERLRKPELLLTFQDANRTDGVEVSIIDEKGNTLKEGRTNSSGIFTYTAKYKRGTELTFKFEKRDYEFEIDRDKRSLKVQESGKFMISFRAVKAVRSITFITKNSKEGVRIYGVYGAKRRLLGNTDKNGRATITIRKKNWHNIGFEYECDYCEVVPFKPDETYRFNNLPDDAIELAVYPNKIVYFSYIVLSEETSQPIPMAEMYCSSLDKTYNADINGGLKISIFLDELKDNQIKLNDKLSFNFSSARYETITKKVNVTIDRYRSSAELEKIFLERAFGLHFQVYDSHGFTVDSVQVMLDDSPLTKTDRRGTASFWYKADRIGETQRFRFNKQFYERTEIDVQLSSLELTKRIELIPFEYYLSCKDYVNAKPIENLQFETDTTILALYERDGKYRLLFPQLSRMYKVTITDRENSYESKETSISLYQPNLGKTEELKLVPKTFVELTVIDNNGLPLNHASVCDKSGRLLGMTGNDGEYRHELKYDGQMKEYRISKGHYKDETVIVPFEIGANYHDVILRGLYLSVVVTNAETGEIATNIPIELNGEEFTTDLFGRINLKPNKEAEPYSFIFSGEGKRYLPREGSFVYSYLSPRVDIELDPHPVLEIHTVYLDPFGNSGSIDNVDLYINSNRIGKTDSTGVFVFPIKDKNKSYSLRASKPGYITESKIIPPGPTFHQIQAVMQRITASFNVYDIDYNNLSGIEVWVEGKRQGTTNMNGRIVVQLDELGKPTIRFIDPKGIYKEKIETYTFQKSKEERIITLLFNPVDLVVNVVWASGAPAVGVVEIDPAPDPTVSNTIFTLRAGVAQIKIYRKGDYQIRYTTTAGPGVSDTRDITILMDSNQPIYESFTIPDASLRVLVDSANTVNVEVIKVSDTRNDTVGSIAGDGKGVLDVSSYGYVDYKFVFTRPGWAVESMEVKRLERPNQLFDFVIKGHYKRCKDLEALGMWQEACDECKQVPSGDPSYCDALTTLMEVYRKKLKDYDLAVDAIRKYIDNSNGTCEENWSYYRVFFHLLSKLDRIPDGIANEGKLRTYYGKFNILVMLQVNDNEKKNTAIENVKEYMAEITLIMMNEKLGEWKRNKFNETFRDSVRTDSEDLFSSLVNEYLKKLDHSIASNYQTKAQNLLDQMQ